MRCPEEMELDRLVGGDPALAEVVGVAAVAAGWVASPWDPVAGVCARVAGTRWPTSGEGPVRAPAVPSAGPP